jgi:hypothetical protein
MENKFQDLKEYEIHKEWLDEFNKEAESLMTKSVEFNPFLGIAIEMTDRRGINLEWLDELRICWKNGLKLYVLRQFQGLSKDRVKYLANVKPYIV